MESFAAISMIFIIGGALGYVLELFYRRIRHGRWINPGFLVGPFLPLYGLGTLLLFGLCTLGETHFSDGAAGKLVLLLLIAAAMTLAELMTGLFFTEGMHVRLWDYRDRWGNFRGIICPLFSLIWAAVGALYEFVLHTYLRVSVAWLKENPYDTFVVGVFFGIFLVDLCYSSRVITRLRALAKQNRLIIGMEALKVRLRARVSMSTRRKQRRAPFLFPFRSTRDITDAMREERAAEAPTDVDRTDESQ